MEKNSLKERLEIRYTTQEDAPYLKKWLMDPKTREGFAMDKLPEVEDAVVRWIGFARYKSSLTAVLDGIPCGMATVYVQSYTALAHQADCGIIVSPEFQNQGIGTELMKNLIHFAKEYFALELLHLQVFANNPSIRLYQRFGFKEFGRQEKWYKKRGEYQTRVFMEREL